MSLKVEPSQIAKKPGSGIVFQNAVNAMETLEEVKNFEGLTGAHIEKPVHLTVTSEVLKHAVGSHNAQERR